MCLCNYKITNVFSLSFSLFQALFLTMLMNVQARAFIVIRTTHFHFIFLLRSREFFSLFICIMFYYFIFFIFCWIILLIRSTDLQHWVHANVTVLAHTWNRQVVLISMYLRLTRKLRLMCVIRWTCTEEKRPKYFILFYFDVSMSLMATIYV